MAEKKETLMLDPIAYRSDYNPDSIMEEYRDDPNLPWVSSQNDNLNYHKYGDDSNSAWQSQLGGTNPKYEGEWVSNSEIGYNPNIKTWDLDPNYKYWQSAKDQNAQEAWYIARRNDNIASALYNEWKITKEDIAYYLASQPDWNNSTEMDRANTIESIWKRIWQMPKKEEEDKEEVKIWTDTSGTIYGKNTADTWNPEQWINTKADVNSAFKIMDEARQANLNTLLRTPPMSIAASLEAWSIPNDMQAIIDLQSFYPDFWREVEDYRKQLRWQDVINAITKWEDIPTNTNTVSNANNSIATAAANMTSNSDVSESMADVMTDIHQTLQSNASAQWANDTMAEIEAEIATLNNRLSNLRKEANNIFKWDTPDYLVNAWINNQKQEIQDKLSILSERYKYASNRYDKEVANAQWEKEYSLKERQVAVQESQNALSWWKEANWITTTTTTTNTNPTTTTSLNWKELPLTSKNRQEIWSVVDNLVNMYNNWQLGNAQCAVWVQTYYLPQLWISFWTLSLWGEKMAIRNEWRDYTPQKWDLIIMASWTKPWNWHMGIVIWMTADGKIQYLDWNGDVSWNEKPAIREIDPNSAKISGYYNATKWQSEWQSWNQWTDYDYTRFEQYRDATSKTEKEAIAAEYWTNLAWMNNLVREALTNRPSWWVDNIDGLTWYDYVWLTDEQIANIEKEIWYNPNIEWELKKIIDKWIPTSWPAMKNVLNTVRAKDEKQLWQWIDHYKNKVNAEALQAWEDILLLLAQLQNDFRAEDRETTETKNWKKVTVFDTNATQWWGWGTIWIKYQQLINQLLLNKVTEAREKWATFWQMTEYEWDILKDAASALRIKFWYWSSDESFSEAFFDLVDATWKLTNWTGKWPTREEWNNYVNQVKNESQWYMSDATEEVSGSNLWWWKWTWWGSSNNEATKEALWIL